MGGGAVIAAAAAARRRRIAALLDAFRLADATAPERAQTLEQLAVSRSREVDELSEGGVLLPGERAGSWYLSEAGFVAHRDAHASRGMRMMAVAILALLLLLGALLIGLVGMRQ